MSRIIANNIRHNDATADSLSFDSSARVGIGTSSPQASLHVDGANTAARGQFVLEGAGADARMTFYRDADFIGHIAGHTDHVAISTETGHFIKFSPAGSERVRIDPNGLKFNGDTAATNALDDYEEGTWSPNIGGTATYDIQWGTYIKVGKQVTCWGGLRPSALGTGNLRRIYGLPFTVHQQVTSTFTGGGSIVWYDGSATSHVNTPALAGAYNQTYAEINLRTGATDTLQANFDFWTTARRANFWITYQVA